MWREISIQSIFMGVLTALVGFGSAFAVVLLGLRGVGASEAQAASGLMAVSVAMGLCAIFLSLKDRIPVWIAWSTPGAALLATAGVPEYGFAEAVGAFIVSGVLISVAGLVGPLTRAVSAIPAPLASAMLAGILLSLCIAPFEAIAFDPALGLPIFGAWAFTYMIAPRLAIPAAFVAFIGVLSFGIELPESGWAVLASSAVPKPELVAPVFTISSALNISVPLFIVTMASQNIPGLAVLKTNKFPLKPGLWFTTTGVFSVLGAPLGGHAVNLAAITAAMTASPEAHPEKSKRYWAAVVAGAVSVVLGLCAGLVTAFVTLAPSILIEAVAGVALITTFLSAIQSAFEDETSRLAAGTTFLMTASGITILGVSGAFWGLVTGILILAFQSELRR